MLCSLLANADNSIIAERLADHVENLLHIDSRAMQGNRLRSWSYFKRNPGLMAMFSGPAGG
jgi:hypothetical protein